MMDKQKKEPIFNIDDAEKQKLKKQLLLITYAIILLVVLANLNHVVTGIANFFKVLAPLFWGIAIAYVLNLFLVIFEDKIMRKVWEKSPHLLKAKRPLSVLITCLAVGSALTLLGLFILPQLGNSALFFISNFPDYMIQLQEFVEQSISQLPDNGQFSVFLEGAWDDLWVKIDESLPQLVEVAAGVVLQILNGVLNIFIGLIIAIYILLSKEKLFKMGKKFAFAVLPENFAETATQTLSDASRTFSNFLRGQIVEACILGGMCLGCMTLLGMPYALLISTLIGITALIPIVGAFLGAVPSALILLVIDPPLALVFVIMIIVLQQIEGNLIYPKVVGSAIGLSGIWVFLTVIIAGSLFGIIGILICVPLVAVVFTILRTWSNKRLKERNIKIE
ncbi:MAG: AI-2E family transporter [Bacillota bacterium]|jgi:predicted PurR-regulated permease PerM